LDDTITTTYYLCEEFLEAVGHRDDRQVRLATAEVMCTALVAAAFFGSNIEKARTFLDEYGYINKGISKSRFNRRLHAIDPHLWRALFDLLGETFKQSHRDQTYVVDSLPVPVCDKSSASSAAGSILAKSMKRLFAATLRVSAAISTGSGYIWWSAIRASLLSSHWRLLRRRT
jgi:hypothetical protein